MPVVEFGRHWCATKQVVQESYAGIEQTCCMSRRVERTSSNTLRAFQVSVTAVSIGEISRLSVYHHPSNISMCAIGPRVHSVIVVVICLLVLFC